MAGIDSADARRDALDRDVVLLLDALRGDAGGGGSAALRRRLLERVAHSAAAARAMCTVRERRAPLVEVAPGVHLRMLYEAPAPQRRGEPRRVTWIELAPHASWAGPDGGWSAGALQRDWLVMRGDVRIDGVALGALDYRVVPAGFAVGAIGSTGGAVVLLREATIEASCDDTPRTAADDEAAWADFAPGIRRRLLWTHGSEAAMLYRAAAGAAVPHHGHGHDEECLMVDGELFLDDVLLRCGDYQLAPAGTEHASVVTDTGATVYAHGDLDLDVRG